MYICVLRVVIAGSSGAKSHCQVVCPHSLGKQPSALLLHFSATLATKPQSGPCTCEADGRMGELCMCPGQPTPSWQALHLHKASQGRSDGSSIIIFNHQVTAVPAQKEEGGIPSTQRGLHLVFM